MMMRTFGSSDEGQNASNWRKTTGSNRWHDISVLKIAVPSLETSQLRNSLTQCGVLSMSNGCVIYIYIYIYKKMTQEFLAFRVPQEFESRKGGEIPR
jgi:hypothetical protein